ncbi:MAG: DUF488 domain-containing protein [Flavobacteriaceae bacterium]
MKTGKLYSIGYGLRSPDEFLGLLSSYQIDHIADVRSNPYSKWNPDFCREPIEAFLKQKGIGYVYIGDMIGGIPKDSNCYDDSGKLNYQKVKSHPEFIKGINRLLNAQQKGFNVALMCGEVEPHTCHRSKLIGEVLQSKKIDLDHILDDQNLKTQTEVMLEITKGKNITDLFGNKLF